MKWASTGLTLHQLHNAADVSDTEKSKEIRHPEGPLFSQLGDGRPRALPLGGQTEARGTNLAPCLERDFADCPQPPW